MILNNKVFIKKNLLQSDIFVIENGDLLTIDKKMGYTLSPPYFECIIVEDDTDDQLTIMADQIVYDPYKQKMQLLNTRCCLRNQDPIITQINICENKTVSLYAFGPEAILIIINNEEK